MVVEINGYEVEIKAKRKGTKNFKKRETMDFLNQLIGIIWDSSKWTKSEGYERLAEFKWEDGDKIFDMLDEMGYYKDCGKELER